MANFDSEFFGLVFPGLQATQKIHAQNSRPELSAFLSNFTFLNPKFIHGDFLLTGETNISARFSFSFSSFGGRGHEHLNFYFSPNSWKSPCKEWLQYHQKVYWTKWSKMVKTTSLVKMTFKVLVGSCSATRYSVADTLQCSCPTPWSATGFWRAHAPATHPPRWQREVRQGPLGGGSCDTPATHSELRNEPRQGCSYTVERDRGGCSVCPAK